MNPAIVDFYNDFHRKVQSRPGLYISGNHSLDVILPNDLIDYANAASGHSGFGSGARARGIRRETSNPEKLRAEIFSSPEALERFLESSEKNADAYIATVRARHLSQSIPKPIMAKDEFWNRYNKDDLARIVAIFGRQRVQAAYNTATIEAFEEEFMVDETQELVV